MIFMWWVQIYQAAKSLLKWFEKNSGMVEEAGFVETPPVERLEGKLKSAPTTTERRSTLQ